MRLDSLPRAPLSALAGIGLWVTVGSSALLRAPEAHSAGRDTAVASVQTPPPQAAKEHHEFYFTRAIYTDNRSRGFGGFGSSRWATDYPKADRQFLVVLRRLANIDAYPAENAIRIDDPAVRGFPFLYALEVGGMRMTEAEVQGLRSYLDAGGFLIIDDFWGTSEWANFEREMARVLPGRPIHELSMDHPLFSSFYDIAEILQVPNVRNGQMNGMYGTPTSERDGYVPHVLGIEDEKGRLQVVINWNTDLGDAWEWAENPYYPLKFSTFAYEMGVNMIVYAMSH